MILATEISGLMWGAAAAVVPPIELRCLLLHTLNMKDPSKCCPLLGACPYLSTYGMNLQ